MGASGSDGRGGRSGRIASRRPLLLLAIMVSAGGTLAGTALGGGGVSISPSSKDFGTLSIGDSETETFEVSSDEERSIESVEITGTHSGDFEVVSDNCSGEELSSGETCTVRVSFSPGAPGAREGTLEVVACGTDGGSEPVDARPPLQVAGGTGSSECSSAEASLRGAGAVPGETAPPEVPPTGAPGTRPVYFPADPPVPGRSFVGRVIRGTVLIQLPGSTQWVPLTPEFRNLPNGTRFDARNGFAILLVDNGLGQYDTVTVWEGVIDVFNLIDTGGARSTLQSGVRRTITELRLSLRGLSCPSRRRARARGSEEAQTSRHIRRRSRRIWATTRRGRFRTRGRYAAGTVRGTRWLTRDVCGGGRGHTGFFVGEGAIRITNLVTGRTRTLSAGNGWVVPAR